MEGSRPKSQVKARTASLTRDPERTRAAILRAATAEITAKGLTGARVDAIAERAGVNKRMLYHYFGDKQGLYLAVLEETYAAIRTAELDLNLKDCDPETGIRKLVNFTWQYFIDHPEFLSLLATENFTQLQTELSSVEEKISITRRVYNDTVETYNTKIQVFPPVIVASLFGFERREFFDAPVEAETAPQVDVGGSA